MTKQCVTQYVPTSEELHQELCHTALELRRAHDRFNYVSEPELVEAIIYEIDSLKAKYNYLLRCIKELSGTARPSTVAASAEPESVAASAVKGGSVCPL